MSKLGKIKGLFGIKVDTKAVIKQSLDIKKTKISKVLPSSSIDGVTRKIESPEYVQEFLVDKKRFFPNIDFSNPINFARFGSAQEYYKKSIENIYKTYPYDGSLKEKYQWHNSSSYLDNYIFEFEYPKTNGFLTLGQNWGTVDNSSTVNATATGDSIYKKSETPQYIFVKGGPNPASNLTYELDNPLEKPDLKKKRFKANRHDTTGSQEQNLNINGIDGNTIEFWLKLPSNPATSQTSPAHAYFDLWNEQAGTQHTYGRILVESVFDVDGSGDPDGTYLDDSIFYISYASGSSGVQRAKIGPSTFPTSENITLSDWNHYAFVMQNNPTGSHHLLLKLYVNGALVDTVHTGSQIANVGTSPFNANIGAYRTGPTLALAAAGVGDGHGTLSGSSIDEFRFWKRARNSEQIGLNWFKQVAGGTNSDYGNHTSKYSGSANPIDLGVYYKFNEGISGISTLDSNVLDYSGRVSNGSIQNYNSSPSMRFVGSAIVSASAATSEFKDPILYKNHPSLISYYDNALLKGLEYDTRNSMGIYSMMPQWMLDEDSDKSKFKLRELTQIISSYFDELFMQTKEISKLQDIVYVSGSLTGSAYKPLPFANRLLTSHGFEAPELFANASVLSTLANRDEDREYDKTLSDVKNQLYTNIYNNLTAINKSKGTEKSIRNLLRSLGVDTELYSINFYANNAEVTLNQSILPVTVEKNFVNFTKTGSFGGSVYQSTASSNTNSVNFITGSGNAASGFDNDIGFTVEAEVLFPRQLKFENPAFGDREYVPLTASLFGMHTAKPLEDGGDTTWDTDDYANFQVYAVKDNFNKEGLSVADDEVYFVLKNTGDAFSTITTQKYKDVYENQKWNFAVKVLPESYPNLGIVSGTAGHRVEFHGYNAIGDQIVNSFNLSSPVSSGAKFLSKKKRLYIGAHRENFTGSLLQGTNVKISACRYWALPLETDEIIAHAIDASNYGVFAPHENAYLFQDFKVNVPKIDTLALNWEFSTLTGSDSNGNFEVPDLTYGSASYGTIPNRYGPNLSALLNRQHTGRGIGFVSSDPECITKDFVYAYKQQVPDNLDISDTIKVLERDDEMFTPRTKPIKFSMSVEKSMYEVISEEMLNFMAACVDASALENLVGRGVNKYRDKYKSLEKVRNLFYEKISNTPDLDKYLEYYEWLDGAISEMIETIIPMSAGFKDIENIVESHVLERNKYQHRFPTMEFKADDPQGVIKGINELLYDWEFGHAPLIPSANGSPAVTTITATAAPTPGKKIFLRTITGVQSEFTVTAGTTNANEFANTGADHGLSNLKTSIDLSGGTGLWATSAVENLGGGSYRLTITQKATGIAGNQTVTSNVDNYTVAGAAGAAADGVFSGGIDKNQQDNCFWWNKRVTRDDAFLPVGNTGVDSSRMNIHSASLQVFTRDFNKPYKISLREEQTKTRLKKKSVVLSETRPFDNSSNITYNTTTFVSASVNCSDDDKINPNLKRKADFQAEISDTKNTSSKYSGDLIVPYSFYSSTVNTPTQVPTGYQVGPEHLRDYYVDTKEVPIQGPFTSTHVGGNQHRNIGLVYKPVQINPPTEPPKDVRPEGWYGIATTAGGHLYYTLVNPSYLGADFQGGYPRADFTRDFIAKSPVNIKNIKTVTTSFSSSYGSVLPIGNYNNAYEIVQTSDRSVNNRYFAENNGIPTTPVQSYSVFNLKDYTVPDRGRHSAIMVNRFSAPGSPEVSSPGYLDAESETYSVYNALPFRNLTVRQPLRNFLTSHSAFGGLDSRVKAEVRMIFNSSTLSDYDANTIQLTATDGTSITYRFDHSGAASRQTGMPAAGASVYVQLHGFSLTVQIAMEFIAAMNHPSGINSGVKDSRIIAKLEGGPSGANVVKLVQVEPGADGNTAITAATLIAANTISLQSSLLSSGTPTGFELGAGLFGQVASFHNTPRNGAERIEQISIFPQGDTVAVQDVYMTASVFDNYWVQHMIPQSDRQYSWIHSSATSFPFGYSQPDPSSASEAATDIVFAENSNHATYQYWPNKATATILFNVVNSDSPGSFSGATIDIISTDGTRKYYQFEDDGAQATGEVLPATDFIPYERVIVQLQGMTSEDQIAGELVNAIDGVTGHNGYVNGSLQNRINATYNSGTDTLTLEQVVSGPAGNTTIGASKLVTDLCITLTGTGFTGGDTGPPLRYFGVDTDSAFRSWQNDRVVGDFIGLNTNLYDILDADNNSITATNLNRSFVDAYLSTSDSNHKLGVIGRSAKLNALNLRRNGPGGFSSWKQIRQSYHPIVRSMHKNNRYSMLVETPLGPGPAGGKVFSKTLNSHIEPPVSFKNYPLLHNFILDTGDDILLRNTYTNNLQRFANPAINNRLNYSGREKGEEVYDDLKKIYIDNALTEQQSSIKTFSSLKYKENIFPMDRNTGLATVRGRELYTVSSGSSDFNLSLGSSRAFWKDHLIERLRSNSEAKNSSNVTIVSGSSYLGGLDLSVWFLDAEEPFFDLYQATSSGPGLLAGFDGHYLAPLGPSGSVLNSSYEPRWNNVTKNGELSYAGWLYNILGANVQGRARLDPAPTSSAPLDRGFLTGKPSASLQYEYCNLVPSGTSALYSDTWIGTHASLHQTLIPSGNLCLIPPYKTAELSERTPWFNSYEDYSDDIRRMAKEYSVLPEYRVSEHIDHYLQNGIKADTNNFLELIGNSLGGDSADSASGKVQKSFFKLYSHSDFLSSFNIFKQDHKKNDTAPFSTVKLECHAVKKLLPYQGFYPAARSVQLGALFSSSFGKQEFLDGSKNFVGDGGQGERLAALYQPFFAPGVFYNTIKSGIAVSYPIHTSNITGENSLMQGDGTTASGKNAPTGYYLQPGTGTIGPRFACNVITEYPTAEIPFEAILDPARYLPETDMYFVYPHLSASVHHDNKADGFYLDQADATANRLDDHIASDNNPRTAAAGIRAKWKGKSDVNYTLAANNFFAETENFFLEKRAPVSFISKPEKEFRPMKHGTKYYMDVILYKTDEFMSYEVPSGSFDYNVYPRKTGAAEDGVNKVIHEIGDGKMVTAPMNVRGMHYGPPYKFSPYFLGLSGTGSVGDGVQVNMALEDPAYAPHCPPYFYGVSRARVIFSPEQADSSLGEGDGRKFSLEEIFSYARVYSEYSNDYDTLDGWLRDSTHNDYQESPASIWQMQLTSSVDIFRQKNTKLFNYEPVPQTTTIEDPILGGGGPTIFMPTSAGDYPTEGLDRQWVIESRFECPSINVYDMDTEALGAGSPGDGRSRPPGSERLYTKGIWKGFGSPPVREQGIFLALRESFPSLMGVDGETNELRSGLGKGSLLKVCGFDAGRNSKKKIGEIASKRKMFEAVVAVPLKKDGTFYGIERDVFIKQLFNINNGNPALKTGDFGVVSDIEETSISDMIRKMKKYNIPPQMNFAEFGSIDPFVMYIFEFEHEFDQNDLSLIWQNVMPDISVTAEKQSSSLEHIIGSQFDFYGSGQDAFQPDTRWMVFKVKQKARNNYNAISVTSDQSNGFSQDIINATKQNGLFIEGTAELRYSYNWPYDFCSLVELAKIDVESNFGHRERIERQRSEVNLVETVSRFDKEVGGFIEVEKTRRNVKEENLNQTEQFNDRRVSDPIRSLGPIAGNNSGTGFAGKTIKKQIKKDLK